MIFALNSILAYGSFCAAVMVSVFIFFKHNWYCIREVPVADRPVLFRAYACTMFPYVWLLVPFYFSVIKVPVDTQTAEIEEFVARVYERTSNMQTALEDGHTVALVRFKDKGGQDRATRIAYGYDVRSCREADHTSARRLGFCAFLVPERIEVLE